MRRLRYYPPDVSTYHVTSKCVDDQFLWRPSKRTTFVIASVLAATLEKYDIGLYAAVVMANHFHLVVRAESTELSAAMQYFPARENSNSEEPGRARVESATAQAGRNVERALQASARA
jgi:REP element-mobilizing transposase RayT